MSAPLVSVIIPTFNRGGRFDEAIRSVLDQTVPDLELILVDDASEDDTSNRAARWVERDRRFIYVRQPENRGAAAARNRGLSMARGVYVAFNDDDCVWHPQKIEKQVCAIESSGPHVCGSYCHLELRELDGSRRIVHGHSFAGLDQRRLWVQHGPPGTTAFVTRRQALLSVGGFDEALPRFQDRDLFFRLVRRCPVVAVPEVLVRAKADPGGISGDSTALVKACAHLDRKYSGGEWLDSHERVDFLWGMFNDLVRLGARNHGWPYFFRALKLAPASPKLWLSGVAALSGRRGYNQALHLWKRIARLPDPHGERNGDW